MINVTGRIARQAHSVTIHLCQHWPSRQSWLRLIAAARTPRLIIHMRQTAASAAN
jgi:hypothetical protein